MPIRRAEPLVARMVGDIELAALHENSRARKRSLQRAGIAPPHDPAAMIEMQMRHDQMRDVAGLHPKCAEMLRQPSVAMIEDLALDCAEAITDSGIDQDRVAALHYKRTGQVEADAIALVGRMIGLPEFARDDAEHASAVIAPQPVGDKRDLERADFDLRWYLSHLTSHQPGPENQREPAHRNDRDMRARHPRHRSRHRIGMPAGDDRPDNGTDSHRP